MKRLISLILTFVMLLSLVLSIPFGVSAAQTANFSIKVRKYVGGSYTNDVNVRAGDVVTLFVMTENEVNNVAGLTMEISFDNSRLEYKDKSFITYVEDSNVDSSAALKDEKMLIMFDTTSKQTALNGNVFSLAFTVISSAASGQAVFSAAVTELFDSSSKAEDISFGGIADASINVNATVIPNEAIEAFERIVNVVYKPGTDEDSADDISAAISALSALDNAQIELLKSTRPELYEAVKTAKTRYSALQQNAAVESVNKEIETFLSKYSDVFKKNPENITLKDKKRIEDAIAYQDNALSSAAKSRVPSDKKKLLKELSAKIKELIEKAEELEEAKATVAEFKNSYKLLLTATDEMIHTNYSDLFLMLEEAELVYSMMSDGAKALLKAERKFLDELKVKLDEALANDEKAKEISEAASEFMNKWKYVFTLNDFNVTVGDESIVKLFLQEYEGLSEELREALKSRVTRVYALVEVIESLKTVEDESATPETNTEVVTQTVTQTVTEKVTDTVTKTVEKGVGRLIFWLVIILGALILMTALPITALLYKKKEKTARIGGEYDEE